MIYLSLEENHLKTISRVVNFGKLNDSIYLENKDGVFTASLFNSELSLVSSLYLVHSYPNVRFHIPINIFKDIKQSKSQYVDVLISDKEVTLKYKSNSTTYSVINSDNSSNLITNSVLVNVVYQNEISELLKEYKTNKEIKFNLDGKTITITDLNDCFLFNLKPINSFVHTVSTTYSSFTISPKVLLKIIKKFPKENRITLSIANSSYLVVKSWEDETLVCFIPISLLEIVTKI